MAAAITEGQYARSKGNLKVANVNMPSGQSVPVTIPAKPCRCTTCTFTVNLILMEPLSPQWSEEYQALVNEMTTTIRHHVLMENGGGRFTSYDIVMIQKVENRCLWKKFRDRERALLKATGYVNERMLFHGTNAADTIVKTGFDKSCANPGCMFGGGIYFAEHSSKANQYVYGYLGGNGCPTHGDKNCYICERKLLLCRVALGRMYKQTQANKMDQPPDRFSSVSGEPSAQGLKYQEYAIYENDQAYPEYLITYKIKL